MKTNPFLKYIKGETAIHFAVAEYLQYQYPDVMFHHSPNESKRTPFERFLVSKMGVSAGFPDFVIYGEGYTLYLELKFGNNTPTDSQSLWLRFLNDGGNYSFVCWSFESAKYIIDNLQRSKSFEKNQSLGFGVLIADSLPSKIKKLINL